MKDVGEWSTEYVVVLNIDDWNISPHNWDKKGIYTYHQLKDHEVICGEFTWFAMLSFTNKSDI